MNLQEALKNAPYESQLAYAKFIEECRMAWPIANKQERMSLCYRSQIWVDPREIMEADNPFKKQRLPDVR